MWDSISHWWHDLWAPSPDAAPAAKPAAPAAARPDLAGGHDASYWQQMTQGACPTNVQPDAHPDAASAQAEYMACVAGAPSGINVAPAAPSPYGGAFNP